MARPMKFKLHVVKVAAVVVIVRPVVALKA
jgi:hypothetical protein